MKASLATWSALLPHDVRAAELEGLGLYKHAHRVRTCGSSLNTLWGQWTCKQRVCPSCGPAIADQNRWKTLARINAMKNPVNVLVQVRSAGLGAQHISDAVMRLRQSVNELRRRYLKSAVPAGVGAIEPKLSGDGTEFLVHSHMAMDVVKPFDKFGATALWKALTTADGHAPGTIQWNDPVAVPAAFAAYASKSDDWSPLPGTATVEVLKMLLFGMRGRRLLIAWPRSIPLVA